MPAATRSRRAQARGAGADAASDATSAAAAASSALFPTGPSSVYDTFAHIFLQSDQLLPGRAGGVDEHGDDAAAATSVRERLLDPEHGIALQYAEACRAKWSEVSAQNNNTTRIASGGFDDMDEEGDGMGQDGEAEAGLWAYEYYAWMILHALSLERTQTRERFVRGEAEPQPSSNPYHPALLRASDVLAQSAALRELNIVREWLHTLLDPYEALPLTRPDGAGRNHQQSNSRGFASQRRDDSALNIVEVRKGYWTFTKNALRAAKRGGQIPASNSTVAGAAAGGLTPSTSIGSSLSGSGSSLFGGIRKSGVGIGGGAGAATMSQKVLKTLDPDAPCRASEGELANEDLVSCSEDIHASTTESIADKPSSSQAYERAFLRSLFVLTRAGKLHDALDLCRQADRPWRAASLRGAVPYFDPNLLNNGDGGMDPEALASLPQNPYGNRNRALWKATARKLAGMKTLDPYERALYGALSGSLEPVLACSSMRWEEALWAYVNAKLEAGIESGLRKSLYLAQQQQRAANERLRIKREYIEENEMQLEDQRFDDEGFATDSVGGNEARRARSAAAARLGLGVGNDLTLRPSEDETALETLSMADVFEQVEARVDRESNIVTGDNALFAAQRGIILGDIRPLLVTFASQMGLYAENLPPKEYHRYVRFFAHIVLYLRSLQSVWRQASAEANQEFEEFDDGAALGALLLPEPTCDDILREYIGVLQLTDQSDQLVALYSSQLLQRQAGVEQYAAYLLSMGRDTPADARSRALSRAGEFGLSLGAVARRTVSLVFADLLPRLLPPLDVAQSELGSLRWQGDGGAGALSGQGPITPEEANLLHALEWLTFDEDTFGNAVLRCNQLARYFLASGRLAAARQALSRLPSDLLVNLSALSVSTDVDEDFFEKEDAEGYDGEDRARAEAGKLNHVEQLECLSWGNLFDALDAYGQYLNLATERDRVGSTAAKKTEYASNLRAVIEGAERAFKELFEGDWLRFDVDEDVPDNYETRLLDYKRIRQLFVPELIFSLHFMLFDSREIVPDALARALVLPNLVADGSHALWQDFISRPEDGGGAEEDETHDAAPTSIAAAGGSGGATKTNRLPEYLEAVRQAELVSLDSLGPDPFRAAILVADGAGDGEDE
ncbi:Nucleoporin nup84 [Tilletia horrida]|nr:Nucleoporin nup84 [Tilletia horrida]